MRGATTGPAATPDGTICAVILVCWNAWEDTIECLDTLLAAQPPGTGILVIDNASTDGSLQHIAAWLDHPAPGARWGAFPGVAHRSAAAPGRPIAYEILDAGGALLHQSGQAEVSLVHAGGNLGFAGGNNVGLRIALARGYRWFWLLNTDTVVGTATLPALLRRAGQGDAVGMVGSTLVHYHAPGQVQALGGRIDRRTTIIAHIGERLPVHQVPADPHVVESQMDYVVGASMLVSRAFVEQVGLMQEDYFLYFEELDWAFRGHRSFRIGYAPDSIVYHKVGGSSAAVASDFSMDLLYRNRMRFVGRFLPRRVWAARMVIVRDLLHYLKRRRWRSVMVIARVLWASGHLARAPESTGITIRA